MIITECFFDFAARRDCPPLVKVSRNEDETEIRLSDLEGAELKVVLGPQAVHELIDALRVSAVRGPGRPPENAGLRC
jgi:hypothetical protein